MPSQYIQNKKNLASLVAKRYDVLYTLYPSNQLSVSDIAQKLAASAGNVSRYTEELRKQELINVCEHRDRKGGKPKKLCTLSAKAKKIMELFEEEPATSLADGQLDEMINMLTDKTLSPDFRAFVVRKISDIAVKHSDTLLKKQKILDLFKQLVTDHKAFDEEIKKGLMSCLTTSIPQMISDKKTRQWYDENIKEPLSTLASNKKAEINARKWAISTLSRAARSSNDPDLLSQTVDQLLSIYFEDESASQSAEEELANFEQNFSEKILEKTRAHTRQPEPNKTKAENLLKLLITRWWSHDLSSPTS